MNRYTKWTAMPVRRPDAAFLFNAVRLDTETNRWEECKRTPSHSEAVAALVARELNLRDADRTYVERHAL